MDESDPGVEFISHFTMSLQTVRSSSAIYSLGSRRSQEDCLGGDVSEEEEAAFSEDDCCSTQSCNEFTDDEEMDGDKSAPESEPDHQTKPGYKLHVRGRDGTKWSFAAGDEDQDSSSSMTYLAMPTADAMSVRTALEAWSLLFTDDIFEIIVQHSNEERERKILNISENIVHLATYNPLSVTELKAFIGLLFYAGYREQGKACLKEMWSTDFGVDVFASTMSRDRFRFIASILRFDDKNTRCLRRQLDVLAPVRQIWDKFISNCQINYSPSSNVTIDKQLLGFKGRFPALVYMKSKPLCPGIKVVCLNDSETYYMYNAIPYTGKVNTNLGEKVSSYYVRSLTEPLYNTNRIVTLDSWFTSVEICDKLKNLWGLDVMGAIRKDKREIPVSFTRPAPIGTIRYAYNSDKKIIISSFVPKRNKVVLLLSTLHKNGIDASTGRPDIVEYYNSMKGAVATFDKMISLHTVTQRTNRWSLRFFMSMLDQSVINSYVIYNLIAQNELFSRSQFIKSLVLSLIRPHLEQRLTISSLRKPVKSSIMLILGKEHETTVECISKLEKRRRCYYCPSNYDKKTNQCCARCTKPVCDNHRMNCCKECF